MIAESKELGAETIEQRTASEGGTRRVEQREEESNDGTRRVPMNDKRGSYSFRFQNLEIWKKAIKIGMDLFSIADGLDEKRLHRFAEQIRGAGLSMSNNIAEGAGSFSKREFIQYLNIARRSTFENANMLILFHQKDLISGQVRENLLSELDELCRMITAFIRSLRS